MLSERIHRAVFILGTALLVIGLPVSYFLLSVSIILLGVNWFFELFTGKAKEKLEILKKRRSLQLIISIYIIHLIWFFNTTDFAFGLHDIRIKLPLLILPLVYGTSPPLSKKEAKLILQFFCGTVLVSSLITTVVLLGYTKLDPVDTRYASLFISHIRFSLMVVLSIFILFYLVFFKEFQTNLLEKISYSLAQVWLICFLVLLQSFTGILAFLILCPLAIIWYAHYRQNRLSIWLSYIGCTSIFVLAIIYALFSLHRYNIKYDDLQNNLEEKTINGNPYQHYTEMEEFENGHAIWIYICDKELRKEWNMRSNYSYDSLDRKGQSVRMTLIRYLSSMGLRKDSLSLAQLTDEDIGMIEKGYANHIYKNKFDLYPRIYELLWEIDMYQKTGNPSGQSLGQRIEFLKVGFNIVKREFWLGTGTGDVQQEFNRQYEIDKSLLDPIRRYRTHNQFITFLISFGIFGFLWIIFALFAPGFQEKKYSHFLYAVFFALSLLSMLNEDTLETHAGVSLFSFFFAFFLYSLPENDDPHYGAI